jgi:hypothetical protein
MSNMGGTNAGGINGVTTGTKWGTKCLSEVRGGEPSYEVPRNVLEECCLKKEKFPPFAGPIDSGGICNQIVKHT